MHPDLSASFMPSERGFFVFILLLAFKVEFSSLCFVDRAVISNQFVNATDPSPPKSPILGDFETRKLL